MEHAGRVQRDSGFGVRFPAGYGAPVHVPRDGHCQRRSCCSRNVHPGPRALGCRSGSAADQARLAEAISGGSSVFRRAVLQRPQRTPVPWIAHPKRKEGRGGPENTSGPIFPAENQKAFL